MDEGHGFDGSCLQLGWALAEGCAPEAEIHKAERQAFTRGDAMCEQHAARIQELEDENERLLEDIEQLRAQVANGHSIERLAELLADKMNERLWNTQLAPVITGTAPNTNIFPHQTWVTSTPHTTATWSTPTPQLYPPSSTTMDNGDGTYTVMVDTPHNNTATGLALMEREKMREMERLIRCAIEKEEYK